VESRSPQDPSLPPSDIPPHPPLVTGAVSVRLRQIEAAVAVLLEKNRVVAEGMNLDSTYSGNWTNLEEDS
jgi:hypothetical protein